MATQRSRRVLGPVYASLLELGHQPIDDLVESAGHDVRRDVESVAGTGTYPARKFIGDLARGTHKSRALRGFDRNLSQRQVPGLGERAPLLRDGDRIRAVP